ncbi:MAG: hypothetical protein KDD90_04080 [Sphingomonadaceae bacterium]|nr:hypothetical protein [Sphingomonadaceae bacterium]
MLFNLAIGFSFLLLLVGACVSVVSGAVGIWRLKKGFKWSWPAVLVPIAVCAIPIIALMSIPVAQDLRPNSWQYEEALGVAPSESIKGLRASTSASGDSRQIYLSFDLTRAAQAEIESRLQVRPIARNTDRIASIMVGDLGPSWFRPDCVDAIETTRKYFHRWDDAIVIQCRGQGKIYAYFSSID